MAKSMIDAFPDAAFDYLDQCDRMAVCSQAPTTFLEATGTFCLAITPMTPDTDFTKADDTSGRKVTMAAKNSIAIIATATGTHVALLATSDTTIRYVTTCDAIYLVESGQVNFPAWKVNIQDPT